MDELRWTLVVPLKSTARAKSRLDGWLDAPERTALVRAMVGDVLAAAAGARQVERIVVVTDDVELARIARAAAGEVPVVVLGEPEPAGLGPAVLAGIEAARRAQPGHGLAVLFGDLPALASSELEEALAAAAGYPRAFVADAAGTGTTLLTARPGVPVAPSFGLGSAQRHRERGHVQLPTAAASGLAHDVDVPADVEAVLALGVGARTLRVVRASPALRALS